MMDNKLKETVPTRYGPIEYDVVQCDGCSQRFKPENTTTWYENARNHPRYPSIEPMQYDKKMVLCEHCGPDVTEISITRSVEADTVLFALLSLCLIIVALYL